MVLQVRFHIFLKFWTKYELPTVDKINYSVPPDGSTAQCSCSCLHRTLQVTAVRYFRRNIFCRQKIFHVQKILFFDTFFPPDSVILSALTTSCFEFWQGLTCKLQTYILSVGWTPPEIKPCIMLLYGGEPVTNNSVFCCGGRCRQHQIELWMDQTVSAVGPHC
jgi:hypothetical protein